jgi:histone acetyltransferase (RNA polymerase elongator complex component)
MRDEVILARRTGASAALNMTSIRTQVSSRIKALENLGHLTDKIELLILGGTWSYTSVNIRMVSRRCFDAMNEVDGRMVRRGTGDLRGCRAAIRRGRRLQAQAAMRPPHIGMWLGSRHDR